MQSEDEINAGISVLQHYAANYGLSISRRRQFDRGANYFEFRGLGKEFDFTLSDDFLMDIPGTPGHRDHLSEYLPTILTRFGNSSPSDFFARSGTPFSLKIHWPFHLHPSRDVVWCHAEVADLRFPDLVAMTTPVIWMGLDGAEFRFRPLARIEAVVNAVRGSLDRSEIQFYRREDHPSETQEIRIFEKLKFSRSTDELIEQFLAGKVFWLAFKRGDRSTKVWIADPWDADYLGVSSKDLIQAAQVLQARALIALTPDSNFASPGESLLLTLPISAASRPAIGFQVPSQ